MEPVATTVWSDGSDNVGGVFGALRTVYPTVLDRVFPATSVAVTVNMCAPTVEVSNGSPSSTLPAASVPTHDATPLPSPPGSWQLKSATNVLLCCPALAQSVNGAIVTNGAVVSGDTRT